MFISLYMSPYNRLYLGDYIADYTQLTEQSPPPPCWNKIITTLRHVTFRAISFSFFSFFFAFFPLFSFSIKRKVFARLRLAWTLTVSGVSVGGNEISFSRFRMKTADQEPKIINRNTDWPLSYVLSFAADEKGRGLGKKNEKVCSCEQTWAKWRKIINYLRRYLSRFLTIRCIWSIRAHLMRFS